MEHCCNVQVKHFSTRTYSPVLPATEDVPCQQGSAKAKGSRWEGFVCAHRERVIILWSFLEVYTVHSINEIVWVWWKEPDNRPGLTGHTKADISMCLVLTLRSIPATHPLLQAPDQGLTRCLWRHDPRRLNLPLDWQRRTRKASSWILR